MKFIIILSFLSAPVYLLASHKVKLADFKGKYYFINSYEKDKEDSSKISTCNKLEKSKIKNFKKYKNCTKIEDPGVPNSVGRCQKSETDKIYFFDDKSNCDDAQADAVAGASS